MKWLSFLLKSIILNVALYGLSLLITSDIPFVVALSVIPVGLAVALPLMYLKSLSFTYRLLRFREGGIFHFIYSRRSLSYIFITIWAIFSSILFLVALSNYTPLEWCLLFFSPIIFFISWQLSNRISRHEVENWWIRYTTIRTARLLFILILATFWGFTTLYFSGDSVKPLMLTGTDLIREISYWLQFGSDFRKFLITKFLDSNKTTYYFIYIFSNLALYYNLSLIYTNLLIKKNEFSRIMLPLRVSPQPATKTPYFQFSFLLTLTIIISIYLILHFNSLIKDNKSYLGKTHSSAKAIIKVSGMCFPLNEIPKKEKLESIIHASKENIAYKYKRKITPILCKMESNIDRYLDWYYSLGGENSRLLNLASGSGQALESKLASFLTKGVDTNKLDIIRQQYLSELKSQIERNKYSLSTLSLPSCNSESNLILAGEIPNDIFTPILTRLEKDAKHIEASIASTSALSASLIAKKILTKSASKAAIKTLTKLSLKKSTSIAASTAAGATIGSISPGPGTVIGAASALLLWFASEKAFIELEELYSRKQHKKDLLSAFRKTRVDLYGEETADIDCSK